MKVYDADVMKKVSGWLPFVAIVKWPPEQKAAAIAKFYQAFPSADSEGLRGTHAWNLIGRNTMIVIGWTNSEAALEKFSVFFTLGTGLTMEVCPAIDHETLRNALKEFQQP